MQEMARGFSLFEEALLVLEAQNPNVEQYTKFSAAFQNAIQGYRVIYNEKKRATTQTTLDHFFKRVELNTGRNQNLCHQCQVSETAACPPSPIADDLQLYYLPPSLPPPVSNSSCLSLDARPCMPAVELYYCTFQGTVL